MKLSLVLGIGVAVGMHAGVILFGGLVVPHGKPEGSSTQTVELLGDMDAEHQAEKPKPEEKKEEPEEELASDAEKPPDATEVLQHLEDRPAELSNDAPALEAASLSAIEAALGGASGGGDFAEALTFSSGGRIGGTGQAGATDEKMEEAFNPSEIDQKPRAVFQESPAIPAEMRGKKIEGVVSVLFVVDPEGKVSGPRIEKSSNAAFESPALAAVKHWKFEPGLRGGQRVASKMRVSIRFPAS